MSVQILAGQWRGMNRRVASHLLEPGEAQEAVNCGPRGGKLGSLGPRLGRTKANATPFTGRVNGLIPFGLPSDLNAVEDTGDRLLIGQDDGSSVWILDEPGLFAQGAGRGRRVLAAP